jgi:hypothetical protein
MSAKEIWKIVYRQMRIARKEIEKSYTDAMLYGIGYVQVSKDGKVTHIKFPETIK